VRLSIFLIALAFLLYSGLHWYHYWTFLRDFLVNILVGLLSWFMRDQGSVRSTLEGGSVVREWVAAGGALLIVGGGALLAYYYIYVKVRLAEFLIQTDGEMHKVTWPDVTPWFRPTTKVWGSTYVVLIVVAGLAVFVFGVDYVLSTVAQWIFYPS